jgi:uncharacterized RDD family membrane protein YckC
VSAPRGLVARFAAALLDYLLIVGWLGVLAAIFVPLHLAGHNPWGSGVLTANLVAFALSVFPVWLYLSVSESMACHATWGKRRMRVRVARRDGWPPDRRRIVVRNVVKLLPWQLAHIGVIPLLIGGAASLTWVPIVGAYALVGVSIALVLLRRDRAALHDLLAGTRVVPAEVDGDDNARLRRRETGTPGLRGIRRR